uniref:Uncharacterized protein n=1 Tax=Echeneis naucrates TaxID=173247 RepID=A0A665T944_ECHNA
MVEQAANTTKSDCVVCMGPRPILQTIPATIDKQCVVEVINRTNLNITCAKWDFVFPVTTSEKKKPIFSKRVAFGNFTCINITGGGEPLGNLSSEWCSEIITVTGHFKPVPRGDIWWWCGDDRLFDKLPKNVTGFCGLVTLLLPVSIHSISAKELTASLSSVLPEQWHRKKKSVTWLADGDPTYIDAIGIPQDRINYIHYNVQKLALDMLLAEKGGVCAMFREQCCTFIPNNTAADGSLTKAIEGLRALNGKMKEHSGVDTSMWDSWMDVFGKYKALVSSVLVSIAVFAAILTLCGCCCVPLAEPSWKNGGLLWKIDGTFGGTLDYQPFRLYFRRGD